MHWVEVVVVSRVRRRSKLRYNASTIILCVQLSRELTSYIYICTCDHNHQFVSDTLPCEGLRFVRACGIDVRR